MTRAEVEAHLATNGLRVPEKEMDAFSALMADIRSVGLEVSKKLRPADEMACVLSLRRSGDA